MDAWDYYKKSVGSIRGQLNTNREAIAAKLTKRGYGPNDEIWISNMGKLDAQLSMEMGVLQGSSIVKNLQNLSAFAKGVSPSDETLSAQLGRRPYPWELRIEGV